MHPRAHSELARVVVVRVEHVPAELVRVGHAAVRGRDDVGVELHHQRRRLVDVVQQLRRRACVERGVHADGRPCGAVLDREGHHHERDQRQRQQLLRDERLLVAPHAREALEEEHAQLLRERRRRLVCHARGDRRAVAAHIERRRAGLVWAEAARQAARRRKRFCDRHRGRARVVRRKLHRARRFALDADGLQLLQLDGRLAARALLRF